LLTILQLIPKGFTQKQQSKKKENYLHTEQDWPKNFFLLNTNIAVKIMARSLVQLFFH
jgi:hypothetical protein